MAMPSSFECLPLKETQIPELVDFAKEHGVDLTVVGPEVPLSAGIADAFEKAGLRIFGPSAAAARIESSKDFAKRLMEKYDIPTAAFKTFDNYDDAIEYVSRHTFPIVLKYGSLHQATVKQSLERTTLGDHRGGSLLHYVFKSIFLILCGDDRDR